MWIRFNTDFNDYRFWWVPWMSIACVALGYALDARISMAQCSDAALLLDEAKRSESHGC